VKIVILGLSVTSSWGNGHATTYRSLIRGLAARGHEVTFVERDLEWYSSNRDEPKPAGCRTEIYQSLDELCGRFEPEVRDADLVIVGSYVPDGVRIGQWVTATAEGVTAFYDIDTPITLEKLAAEDWEYVTPALIAAYDLYLSFTGGPTLDAIERKWGSPAARALYCSVDTSLYRPRYREIRWDLGYLGTWSEDRQPGLDQLLLEPARRWTEGRFTVAGPLYPNDIAWPANVDRTIHLSPREHADFYGAQRFALNITRTAMKRAGYSPSVRLFEAAACGTPLISDWWPGLDTIFEPGREILLSASAEDTLRILRDLPNYVGSRIAGSARNRVLAEHTPEKRASQLEAYYLEARTRKGEAVPA
jgi:spore maturation protein CgeB